MKHLPDPFIQPKSSELAARAALPHGGFYRKYGKRLFDLCVVTLSLPFTLPLIAVTALLVMMDGASPFFGHKRIGRNGREFRCWKLRSMVPDAEVKLQDYLRSNPEAAREWAETFKLTNDPRVTRLGRFIRKTSLDELPQILNIFRGEMSCVGPRPVTAKEIGMYGVAVRHYHSVRPGLTGLWQVSGRNDIGYDERVALDIKYAQENSLVLDFSILVRTVGAVLFGTGR